MRKLLLLLFVAASALSMPVYAEDEPKAIVSGTVSTTAKKPMAGVQVVLLDETDAQIGTGVTDARGGFSLKHNLCHRCTLEIIPALDTHYACALLESIPGDANRNFLLSLQRGFTVSGRVLGDKKPVKGLSVKVISLDTNSEGKKVHDGGIAKTARNGSFTMILTPGHKKLDVLNEKNPQFDRHTTINIDVTGDAELADIELRKPFAPQGEAHHTP